MKMTDARIIEQGEALLNTPELQNRKWFLNGNLQRQVTRLKNGTGNLAHARKKVLARVGNVLKHNKMEIK
jgi:hypothetical protein